MLADIANVGNGKYYSATSTRVGLNDLFNKLNKLEKEEIQTKVYSEYEEQFPYLIWIVIFLLIIEITLFNKKSKWFHNINIFKVNKK